MPLDLTPAFTLLGVSEHFHKLRLLLTSFKNFSHIGVVISDLLYLITAIPHQLSSLCGMLQLDMDLINCPHQMLQDPSFQLMHQTRKQELLLKFLKCCRNNSQQLIFPKAPVCQHPMVKPIISKVRG